MDLGLLLMVAAGALFLRARLLALMGRDDEAIEACRRAAEHPFKTQSGDGLLLWGDLLSKRGRIEEARAAWSLARERDPESASAGQASQRLSAPVIA